MKPKKDTKNKLIKKMKRHVTQIVSFASLLLVISCSNDDNNGHSDNGNSPANGIFTAKIDGVDFTAIGVSGVDMFTEPGNSESRSLSIIALDEEGAEQTTIHFHITILHYAGQGVYDIIEEGNVLVAILKQEVNYNGNWSAPYGNLKVGEVRITSHVNTKVKGNFELTAQSNVGEDTITITEGKFEFTTGFIIPTD